MRLRLLALALALATSACGPATVTLPPDAGRDPCLDFACPADSRCVLAHGEPRCDCNPGFEDDGAGRCVVPSCQPNPCTEPHRTACRHDGTVAICSCVLGYRDDGSGRCVPACQPNPCTAPHQGVCVAVPTGTLCQCDQGYVEDGKGGCRWPPPEDCPSAHLGGDVFEPDECRFQARVLALPASEVHSLSPAGDMDWFAFDAREGMGYEIRVESSETKLTISLEDATSPIKTTEAPVLPLRPKPGRYFIRIQALVAGTTGAYTLKLLEFGDDFDNTQSSAVPVAVGSTTSGSVDYVADEDWFSFATRAGHDYRVTLASTTGATCNLEGFYPPAPTVRAPGMVGVRSDYDDTMLVKVSGSGKGPYSLTVEEIGSDDHGDTVETATPWAGSTLAGTLVWNDLDFFSLPVTAGRPYRVTVRSSQFLRAWVFASAGSIASGEGTTVVLPFVADHRPYSLRLGESPWSTYTVEFEELVDEHGNVPGTATPIGPEGATGEIQLSGDVDVFALATVPRRIYSVALGPQNRGTLKLLAADGTVLQSSPTQSGPRLDFCADQGPSYISVSGGVQAYTLQVTELGVDDHGNSASTATPLAFDTPTGGILDLSTDEDWFSFDCTAASIYAVTFRAESTPGPKLNLTDGTRTFANPFLAPASGTCFARVRGAAGPYALELEARGTDDAGDTPATASPLTVGAPALAAAIQYTEDVDVFSFEAAPGALSLVVTTTGLPIALQVTSTSGASLASGFGPGSLPVTLPAAGTYHLLVKSGLLGTYSVRVAP